MEIKRLNYLNRLIDKQDNGMIKIITGLRRSGKSYLLYNLFRKYILENITDENHIIYLALDAEENKKYWDSSVLNDYLLSKIENEKEKYYILLDEIQKVEEFVPVLNGFLYRENVDVYVVDVSLEGNKEAQVVKKCRDKNITLTVEKKYNFYEKIGIRNPDTGSVVPETGLDERNVDGADYS